SKRVPLLGLESGDVERFIRESTGYAPAAALVRTVCDATDGNPFFVDAFVRLLMAEGRIQCLGPSPLYGFPIPGEVREAIRRRTDSVGDETRRLLSLASVLGREFDLTILAQASGLEVEVLLELLREAQDAGIIRSGAEAIGRYNFSHALVRETLYDDQGPTA